MNLVIFIRLAKSSKPKIFEESSDEEDEETPEERGNNILRNTVCHTKIIFRKKFI